MSKTIEEIKAKRLLKDYIESKNNQIKQLQEQNAELVRVLERCKDLMQNSIFTPHKNTALLITELLTKHNHLNKKP